MRTTNESNGRVVGGRTRRFAALCLVLGLALPGAFAEGNDADSPAPGTPTAGGAPEEGPRTSGLSDQASSKYFSDLGASTASYNAYIDYLYAEGIILGYKGSYYPGKNLTRADLAAMLYEKYQYSSSGSGYVDLPSEAYYAKAVTAGKAAGVFESAAVFKPNEIATRERAAIWMFESERKHGLPSEFESSDLSVVKDASSISADARKAVATMLKLGVLSLDSSGKFNPTSGFTRAEIAPSLYRLFALGGGAGGQPPSGGPGAQTGASTSAAGGQPPAGGQGDTGSQTVDHGTFANIAATDASGKTYASSKASENALRVQGKVSVKLEGISVVKTGDASGNGDSSSFYGLNAGLLATDGATASIGASKVTTSAKGANGVFSYGTGTTVTVSGTTIRTSSDGSGGVMVAGGGTLRASDCDIETKGGSSAALRSDRGGGTLEVSGGVYVTHGSGSPAIYSTAAVSVSFAELRATGSEAIVIEGKNSVILKNCAVSGKMVKDNVENLQTVMIYQSMSGDAAMGKSAFSMTGGSLTGLNGDLIYVTNTDCSVRLEGVALKLSNDNLLKVVGNDARNGWGKAGSNGGKCDLAAVAQALEGKIKVDSISSLSLSLAKGSSFVGSINSEGQGGSVSIALDDTSVWKLTADCYVSSLKGSTDRIDANGHKLFVAGKQVK